MEKALQKKKLSFPDVFALMFIIALLAMVLTWVLPAGSFDRVTENGLTKVVAGSYHTIEKNPQTPWDVLCSVFQGFVNGAGTIFMICFAGSAINMAEETRVLSSAFIGLSRRLKGKELITIAVVMFALGLANAAGVFANIGPALIPIGIYIAHALGGDNFLGFLIIYCGLMAGFSTGFANPSVVGLAQTYAELPMLSGLAVRAVICVVNIFYIYMVTVFYYKMIRKDHTKSLSYLPGMSREQVLGMESFNGPKDQQEAMTGRQKLTLAVFALGVVACVVCTIIFRFGAQQIAAFFLGIAILTGFASGFSMNQVSQKFINGIKPVLGASFVIGFANAVSILLNNGGVMDTIVNAFSKPLMSMGAIAGAGFMVVFNILVNILIPSAAGQAAIVMPLMVPLADLAGITRQVCVQAYQFGDGLCNLLTPLNAPMLGSLALVGVSYPKYIKYFIKFLLVQFAIAIVVTMVLQSIGWTGL